MYIFETGRQDLKKVRLMDTELPLLAAGQILLSIEAFALTANNVTYGLTGNMMQYWDFFPSSNPKEWGRVPAWGFACVTESLHPDVAVGTRVYGFFPMASHLIINPVKISPNGFIDGAAHRSHLNIVYNSYVNVATDPLYQPDTENIMMLFRPLFTTSFLIDDFLGDNDYYGAEQIILSSASSKTAMGAAFLLHQNKAESGQKIIGLTSSSNMEFVRTLGFYDQVVSYDAIDRLDNAVPTVYVDMAGSMEVRSRIHHHFGDVLKYSCAVGASHWDAFGQGVTLPGPAPSLFFAPAQANKRSIDWGTVALNQKIGASWNAYIASAKNWLNVKNVSGGEGLEAVWQLMLDGSVDPKDGYIIGLNI